VKVGDFPYAIEVDKKNNRIFVTNQRSNTVSVIDRNILKTVSHIEVGEYPEGISLHPDKNRLYVANWFDNMISVIDVNSLEVVDEIGTEDGCRAYGQFISKH